MKNDFLFSTKRHVSQKRNSNEWLSCDIGESGTRHKLGLSGLGVTLFL